MEATGREEHPEQWKVLEYTKPSRYSLTISKPKPVNLPSEEIQEERCTYTHTDMHACIHKYIHTYRERARDGQTDRQSHIFLILIPSCLLSFPFPPSPLYFFMSCTQMAVDFIFSENLTKLSHAYKEKSYDVQKLFLRKENINTEETSQGHIMFQWGNG